jgi:DNA-binding CsgD family transcriptional regulator
MPDIEAAIARRVAVEPIPCEALTRNAICERLVDDKLARYSARDLASYLVDGAARVLRANDAATSASSPYLAVRAGRLHCQTRADQTRLESALAHAALAASAAAYVRLSRTQACTNPLALVASVSAMDIDAAGLALVTLVDAGARVRARARSLDMLTQAFGLTAREAEVGALISTGADIATVALRLGVGVGTARNYLKNVMQKLEVHSQVELAAVVAELSNLAAA